MYLLTPGALPRKMALLVTTVALALPHGSVLVDGHASITFKHAVASMPLPEAGAAVRLLMPSTFASRVLPNIALAITCDVSIIWATSVARGVTWARCAILVRMGSLQL